MSHNHCETKEMFSYPCTLTCVHTTFLTGMGGDHGPSKAALPDYKIWKWEGTPLEMTQQRLARRGLRDPWMRYAVLFA